MYCVLECLERRLKIKGIIITDTKELNEEGGWLLFVLPSPVHSAGAGGVTGGCWEREGDGSLWGLQG